MRIADYLNSADDDGAGERHEASVTDASNLHKSGESERSTVIGGKLYRFRCWKLVSRLFSFTWECGSSGVTGRGEQMEEEEDNDTRGSAGVGDSGGTPGRICEGCEVRVTTSQNLTGSHKQESNFNLVAGLGLLLLIAVIKTELEKAVELRRQMESFFQNLKEECQSKNKISEPSESEISCGNEDAQHGARHCDRHFYADHSPELSRAPSEITIMCDQFSKSDTAPKEECTKGVIQFEDLEVELETELELLQLHIQAEDSSQHEWQSADTPTASSSMSTTEMVYDQHAYTIEQCGVNPYELEKRLHELLEARQEERIRELESDLIETKQKLQEKEIEASWWKDTTNTISEHAPESSLVLR